MVANFAGNTDKVLWQFFEDQFNLRSKVEFALAENYFAKERCWQVSCVVKLQHPKVLRIT